MINTLKSILHSSIHVRHQTNRLTLVESNDDALLKEVDLLLTRFVKDQGGLLKNAVVISADSNKEGCYFSQYSFFLNQDTPDITRQCDYIIFHQKEDHLRVILCELKSSLEGVSPTSRIHKQFTYAECFSRYVIDIVKSKFDDATLCLPVTYHKVALISFPNVAHTAPTGMQPQAVSQLPNTTTKEGIQVFPLQTDSLGKTSVLWQSLMQSVA
ncbi:hypothetical protein VCR15J2_360046 [Vibrio coralliirubri]|uniref:hypothetical protein n=1 Tax=Vibrio coralliirubri TaxID=1516159 RepID=UPI000637B2B3|nr:hypothetical protein [Vibrio coralliirubri]CDT52018.1 hypothetical protein VCR15J2_360046 [Vibrio coralliirubri]